MDALNIIWEKKDKLELILTNVQRTDANRHRIIKHIENEFRLQTILMPLDVDDTKNASRGGGDGITIYILKSLSVNEVNNLWALAREKGKRELSSGKLVHAENASSSVSSEVRKRTIEANEQNANVEKKPRVVWTKEMHQKFLEAIAQLGHDKAFPKKIVELMNVPGLTRENVASHLQKYRMCMKRAQEGIAGSSYDFTDPFSFSTSQGNFQQSHWNTFQMGSRNPTTSHIGFNCDGSRLKMPPDISFRHATQMKLEHNFRVYGDEKKNVLLSIGDSRVPLKNASFIGFRLAGDGKSVEFGQSSLLGDGGRIRDVNESYIQSPSTLSVQQQHSLSEMGNDNFRQCPSFPVSFTPQQNQQSVAPRGTDWGEPVRFSSQQQQQFSMAALLGIDKSMPAILTQQQAFAALPGTDWDAAAGFIEPQSSLALPGNGWGEPVRFTCQQQSSINNSASFTQQEGDSYIASLLGLDHNKLAILTQQQPSAVPQEADWDEAASFTRQQSSVAPPWANWDESLWFTCQQQSSITTLLGVEQNKPAIMAQPQSSAAQPGTEWDEAASCTQLQSSVALPGNVWGEPASFSLQQPPSQNDANANSEIFSNFTATSLPPQECYEPGMVGDDIGVDTTAICVLDDLLFDGQDFTS